MTWGTPGPATSPPDLKHLDRFPHAGKNDLAMPFQAIIYSTRARAGSGLMLPSLLSPATHLVGCARATDKPAVNFGQIKAC